MAVTVRAPLGWQQLRHRPLRLLVALLGIAFAVLLIMMQLGFRSALFESAVRFHERFSYDIALFSPDSVFIMRPQPFSLRRLYQTLADERYRRRPGLHLSCELEGSLGNRQAQPKRDRLRPR